MIIGIAKVKFFAWAVDRVAVAVLFAGFVFFSSASAQLSTSIYDEIRGITLLETDRETVKKLLKPGSFTMFEQSNSDEFFRENYNIRVDYSSGECRDTQDIEDDWFLGSDVWNVGLGKVVQISIEPKVPTGLSGLGLDISNLKKERLYPNRKNYDIYFNKVVGMAITVMGGRVDSIQLFPPQRGHAFLCDSDKIRQHYLNSRWRFQAGPKIICILISLPSNVTDVLLKPFNGGSRELAVNVKAEDPENDVLSYMYKVSGGHIIGTGSKAVWDLTGEKPGAYTITAAADDGAGPRGKFFSKTVVVN